VVHILYLWLVIGGGFYLLAGLFQGVDLDYAVQYVTLIALGVLSEWLVVSFPYGQLSSGFAVVLAAFLLFGFPAAAWVGALGTLFGQGIVNRGNPMRTTLFNAAQCALAIAAGALAYDYLGGASGERFAPSNVLPVLAFAGGHLVANHVLVYLYIAPRRRSFPSISWYNTLVWDAGTYLFVIPLAYLASIIYTHIGPTAAYLLFLPALGVQLLLRHTVKLELSNRELSVLYEVAKRMGASVNLTELLNFILAETRRIIPYHTAAVYLWDDRSGLFRCCAVRSPFSRDLEESTLDPDEGYAAPVIQGKEPVVVYDTRGDARLAREAGLPQFLRSLIIIPLLVEDQVSGVFVVGARRPGVYDERNLHILTIIAGQAAVAINNTLLYDRVATLTGCDALTGLPGRQAFLQQAGELLLQCREEEKPAVALLLEIAGLARINRRYGDEAGDAVLQQVAALIARRCGPGLPVGRYGDDAFAVFFTEAGEIEVAQAAERLRRAVEQRSFRAGDGECAVSLRSATAIYPRDGETADALLAYAEESLRAAAATGDAAGYRSRAGTGGLHDW